MIEAVRQGRTDFSTPGDIAWLAGIIRNKARMAARGSKRRIVRDTLWQAERPPAADTEPAGLAGLVADLPPSLRAVAALALAGQTRREIAYLLRLSDTALRQRLAALRRTLAQRGVTMPEGLPGLGGTLNYGRIRDALLPILLQQQGLIAAHDPDGHLFVIRGSQNRSPRQL